MIKILERRNTPSLFISANNVDCGRVYKYDEGDGGRKKYSHINKLMSFCENEQERESGLLFHKIKPTSII